MQPMVLLHQDPIMKLQLRHSVNGQILIIITFGLSVRLKGIMEVVELKDLPIFQEQDHQLMGPLFYTIQLAMTLQDLDA